MRMFYLFRTLEDLKTCGSYWKKFQGELKLHSEEQQNLEQKRGGESESYRNTDKKYKFWPKGFEILQNFQDRFTLERKIQASKGSYSSSNKSGQPDASDTKNSNNSDKESLIPHITELLSPFS